MPVPLESIYLFIQKIIYCTVLAFYSSLFFKFMLSTCFDVINFSKNVTTYEHVKLLTYEYLLDFENLCQCLAVLTVLT